MPSTNRRKSEERKHQDIKILKSELNAKNKIAAIRTLAVPLLRNNFGLIV